MRVHDPVHPVWVRPNLARLIPCFWALTANNEGRPRQGFNRRDAYLMKDNYEQIKRKALSDPKDYRRRGAARIITSPVQADLFQKESPRLGL